MVSGTEHTRRAGCRSARVYAGLLLLFFATVAVAQLPTATILGTVRDSTGAVVPDATVTGRNTETGLTRTGQSGADGSYRFAALPVGTYEIRVEQAGFRAEVRSGVTLTVGQEAVLNFALQVGAIEQTVEVTGEAPLVNTTTGSLGSLVNAQQVADLPLNGRNYLELSLLQPGVIQHQTGASNARFTGAWFSTNGAPPRSNYYILDGTPVGNVDGGTAATAAGTTLGVEGIREWRLMTNSYSAEFGMRMGGQMTMVSKAGTNQFHGSLFEYLRNSALDARNFFDYKTETTPRRLPAFTRNQFGGSIGGPLQRDRLFFFATFEGLRERLGVTRVPNVIPAAAKVDGGAGGVPQILPAVKPILALFPDPNLSGNRYTFPSTQSTSDNYGQARGDYIFSTNDTVFSRYTIDRGDKQDPLNYPQFIRLPVSRNTFVTVAETHTFNPVLLGTFRFSVAKPRFDIDTISGISGPQVSLVPGQEIGTITIGNVTVFGPDNTTPSLQNQSTYAWSGDLFYTRGRHSLKFGTLINYTRLFVEVQLGGRGTVTFANIPAFLRGETTSYSALTLGSDNKRNYRYKTFGFYVQDDLRATSNLTLNLGLRYEFTTDWNEANGRGTALRDVRRDPAFTPGLAFQNPSLRNISPRFGFALDVRGDGQTAVRGGFGLLYDVGTYAQQVGNISVATPPLFESECDHDPRRLRRSFVFP